MKIYFTIFLVFLSCFSLQAQLADEFSDGNLDGWMGDPDHFIINASQQLQLNAPMGAGESWLYHPLVFTDSMEWNITIRLDFAPSTSNQLRLYLGLTGEDPATATGYFIEIGATGTIDAVDLKYLSSGVSTLIASSEPGIVSTEPVDIRLRVLHHDSGLWEIFDSSNSIPELLFSTTHNITPLSSLSVFGIFCKYTDTRRDKFLFDDILIQPLQSDETAPQWLTFEVVDEQTILLTFDEVLDANSVTPNEFSITPGGIPSEINLLNNHVTLSWASPFIDQQTYQLNVGGVKDVAGNIHVAESREFTFKQISLASPDQIIITEIMADPTPVVGLPDAEYIEIYNNSQRTFELSDYQLIVGTSRRDLPAHEFSPGEYLIITDDANEAALSSFGTVIILASMPGLTNDGTSITIANATDEMIDEVNYTSGWYQNPNKSGGGWSLEQINPMAVCAGQSNWAAANNLTGGTPGSVNSIWAPQADTDGPQLQSLFVRNDNTIELRYDEKLDEILSADPELYSFTPSLTINNVSIENNTTVVIQFADALMNNQVYTLSPVSVFDCLGNEGPSVDALTFGLIVSAEPGDVLINEILFNPVSGGSRYIELINVSEKFIDLTTLAIARKDGEDTDIYLIQVNEIITPGEIVVITPSPEDILARYTVPHPENLFASTLPSWDDKSDHAGILSGGVYIDSFTYTSAWHHPVISDENGVSLERISTASPSSSSSTWQSASSVSGHGTPTGPNSQQKPSVAVDPPFSLLQKNFSPDGDGFNDFIGIQFEPEDGNSVASVWVFDLEGREIYRLLTNETLGTSAFVQWDGRDNDGAVADMGIYIIFVQLWDTQGNVKEYQETCALVKR